MRIKYIISFFHIVFLLAILSVKLLWILLFLEWSIWKSRRSFEELVAAYGMSKKSARKMGAVYRSIFKRSIRGVFRRSLGG
ncbi:MAG: hypothetical protein QW702_06890 [Candidatus Bathyarchaeia archaeon]